MTKKFGVSLSDDVAGDVEEYRIREDPETGERDIASRSEALEELVRIGLVATEVIESHQEINAPIGRPREALVRQALLDEIRRESE